MLHVIAILGGWLLMMGHYDRSESHSPHPKPLHSRATNWRLGSRLEVEAESAKNGERIGLTLLFTEYHESRIAAKPYPFDEFNCHRNRVRLRVVVWCEFRRKSCLDMLKYD